MLFRWRSAFCSGSEQLLHYLHSPLLRRALAAAGPAVHEVRDELQDTARIMSEQSKVVARILNGQQRTETPAERAS